MFLLSSPANITGSVCSYGDVRLIGGATIYDGRVEVCVNNQWGALCTDSWDNTDATTICKQLGYSYTRCELIYNSFLHYSLYSTVRNDQHFFLETNTFLFHSDHSWKSIQRSCVWSWHRASAS